MEGFSGAREFYYHKPTKTLLKRISEDKWFYNFLSIPTEISYSNSNNLFLEDTIKIRKIAKGEPFEKFAFYSDPLDEEVFLDWAMRSFLDLLDEDFNRNREK